jgi:hypothetical protein
MPGSFGTNPDDNGVVGQTNSDANAGVNGRNDGKGFGVFGFSQGGAGVEGHGVAASGVVGFSTAGVGVRGTNGAPAAIQPDRGCGVIGETIDGIGVFGTSDNIEGVKGVSEFGTGVRGANGGPAQMQPDRGCGVIGESIDGFGVFASSDNHFAIKAVSKNGVGLSAEGTRLAAFFRGDVEVTGDIRFINGDFAEEFDIQHAHTVEPGTVMVLNAEGGLQSSQQAYDQRVAGVISGAGNYKPAIILDQQASAEDRLPLALVGKAYCKVDAQYASIEVGDLLTTSPTPGHAMKVNDPFKAFGAVIGKALRPPAAGQGMVPILIALQ